MCRPPRSSKKYLARPFVSKNRLSAGWPWLVMTDLAAKRRGFAAAKTLLRYCEARPSKKLDIQPTDTAAILEDAIAASPCGDFSCLLQDQHNLQVQGNLNNACAANGVIGDLPTQCRFLL